MKYLNETEFTLLKPAEKKAYLKKLKEDADLVLSKSSERDGMTQGNAFLWVNVYGKDKLSRAFKTFLKKSGARILTNYRGAKFAWYFGSTSNVGTYDRLMSMTKFLSDAGVPCFVEDAWD